MAERMRIGGRAGALSLPTGRIGRLLALGIGAILLLLLWQAIGSPLRDWYGDRAVSLDGRRALAARMEMLAAQLPALRRAVASGAQRPGPVALIEGGSDAIASAALQERVQQMATSFGATLSSTESLPAAQAGAYRRVGVRIAVSAPYDVMVRLMAAIEQASPAMLIDDLQLHGSRIQLEAAAPLEGALTVLAFRQDGAGHRSGGSQDAAEQPDSAEP